MEFFRPGSWREALEIRAVHPGAVPIFGGTDVMVDLNFDRERPEVVLDLTRVPEIQEWGEEEGRLRVGAGVTYTRIIAELGSRLQGLAMASRTVGSPQIRNRGTVGATSAPPLRPATRSPRSTPQTPRWSWPPPKATAASP